METFTASLAFCARNSSVTGEFPAQRPVTRNIDISFDLRLNKRLSKQSWGWWFEVRWRSWWRHCNVVISFHPLQHRIWAAPDKMDQARYALRVGTDIANFFEQEFHMTFHLPKLGGFYVVLPVPSTYSIHSCTKPSIHSINNCTFLVPKSSSKPWKRVAV